MPEEYRPLFKGKTRLLKGPRGWGAHSLDLAQFLAVGLECPLVHSSITRLLVDCERTADAWLFSEITSGLPPAEKLKLVQRYHLPYHERLRSKIAQLGADAKTVVHISIHSFTREVQAVLGRAEIDVMYDRYRDFEPEYSRQLQGQLVLAFPNWRITRSCPWERSDGILCALRDTFGDEQYIAVKLRISQRTLDRYSVDMKRIALPLSIALEDAADQLFGEQT